MTKPAQSARRGQPSALDCYSDSLPQRVAEMLALCDAVEAEGGDGISTAWLRARLGPFRCDRALAHRGVHIHNEPPAAAATAPAASTTTHNL